MVQTRARAARRVREREESPAEGGESSLFPPFARHQLEALEQAALDAVGEMVGLPGVPATVDAVIEQQARADFFPFVRAWNAPLLENHRLLTAACTLAGVEETQADAALQWRDAVMSFAALLRPALVATKSAFVLPAFAAMLRGGGAAFDTTLLALVVA